MRARRAAYEVLSDTRLRDIYNKFGEAGIEEDKTSAQGGQWALMAVFYVIWIVVSFLLTMGKQNTQARVWVYTGLVALASEHARRARAQGRGAHGQVGHAATRVSELDFDRTSGRTSAWLSRPSDCPDSTV